MSRNVWLSCGILLLFVAFAMASGTENCIRAGRVVSHFVINLSTLGAAIACLFKGVAR